MNIKKITKNSILVVLLLAPLSTFALFDWGHDDHYDNSRPRSRRYYRELDRHNAKEAQLREKEAQLHEEKTQIKQEAKLREKETQLNTKFNAEKTQIKQETKLREKDAQIREKEAQIKQEVAKKNRQ